MILLVMPTRGRPWSALEAIASVMKTADNPEDVAICICCDADDPDRISLSKGGTLSAFPFHCYHAHKRLRFIEHVNEAVKGNVISNIMHYPWSHVGWLADDIRFRTQGWDTLVRSHNELVVYGDDGYQGEKMATHPFIRVEIPIALGFLLPAELVHGPSDIFIQDIARECNSIRYDSRIVTEHLHPDAGKGVVDKSYEESRQAFVADEVTYREKVLPRIKDYARQVSEYGKAKPKKD